MTFVGLLENPMNIETAARREIAQIINGAFILNFEKSDVSKSDRKNIPEMLRQLVGWGTS